MSNEAKPGQIFTLMSRVMGEVNEIGKNSKNQSQGYRFRGVDDVMAAFHGPLTRHGVFFLPEVMGSDVVERQSQKGGTLIYTTVDMAFTFYAPDGSSVTARTKGEAMDSGDKSTNKAMSAALKYALLQTFCVPVDAADDSDSDSHDVTPVRGATTPRPPVQPKATGGSIDLEIQKAMGKKKVSPADLNAHVTQKYQKTNWKDCTPEEKKAILDVYLGAA